MCGIAGALNIGNNIKVEKLQNMTDIIRYRGPDDEGFYLCSKYYSNFAYGKDSMEQIKKTDIQPINELYGNDYFLGFGHRRLSIIDISSKNHQPMSCSGVVITYNGEIYNYIELKRELEEQGYEFKTDGDTEVIINSYKKWGEDCVNHFNGIWSFAIWDQENSKLFCSRDRFGEKPFYYYFDDKQFIFASEIKQLIEYGIQAKVNEKILFTFLHYGIHDHSEETFFENIYQLRGGHSISINLSLEKDSIDLKKYKYWSLSFTDNNEIKDFKEESKNIGQYFEKSIEIRLRSDVEIGSCLSGGLDSSSVVSSTCRKLKNANYDNKYFKTFTSCYDDAKEVDERYYSDLVVANSGCDSIKVKPHPDKLKSDFESIIWHQDEPFGSLSIFAGWCIMESAKLNGINVLLDGQGGDEVFLGYERFYAYALKEMTLNGKLSDAFKEYKLCCENSKLNFKLLLKYLIYFNNSKLRKKRLKNKNSEFLSSEFSSEYVNINLIDDLLEFKSLKNVQHAELFCFISHLLRYEDRNSMAHSIETRLPFLDYLLVQKSVGLPTNYKMKDGWTKACLREYMKDKMPEEVVYRKNKLGFSVPQEKWLNELNDYFIDTLLDNPKSSKYFNMNTIKKLFNDKTNADMRFKFIVVEMWLRTFDFK